MGENKPVFKLNFSDSSKKFNLKRKIPSQTSSEQTDRSPNRPFKVHRTDHRPQENVSNTVDLESFLAALPETVTDSANTVVSSGIDDEANVPNSTTSIKKPKETSKLDKIIAEHASHPFQKRLYQPNPNQSAEKALAFRSQHGISVETSNNNEDSLNTLYPVSSWHLASLPLPMMNVIDSLNYRNPTPIQAQSLPIIMSGDDMLGIAPTGSGKTAAFLIPLCKHVVANLQNYQRTNSRGPFALVMVPTRELCVQIHRELLPWARSLQLYTLSCYGGSDISAQISALVNNRCHIVIATPGRLIDLLAANNGRVVSLGAVTFLVVDETDRMFDLGFGPQVRKVVESVRPDRQTVVFSATLSPQLEPLVNRILHDPVKVTITNKKLEGESAATQNRAVSIPSLVRQTAFIVANDDAKLEKLQLILEGRQSTTTATIAFVNTQTLADWLSVKLSSQNLRCQALHGGMDQQDRDDVINEFRQGRLNLLIATSVAARGLDVKNLTLVINYDPPTHLEDYVHRAGRTGRAGNEGECITLLLPMQEKEAWYLSQFFTPTNDIKQMADHFLVTHPEEVKGITSSSKWKGFSGHGLSKLDEQRHLRKAAEIEVYTDEDTAGSKQATPDTEEDNAVKKTSTNAFAAKLNINDIPKDARIAVTSLANQSSAIDRFHVSLTLRGTYYETFKPNVGDNEKLHLQIEGNNRENVTDAYQFLREIIERNSTGAHPRTKYSSF